MAFSPIGFGISLGIFLSCLLTKSEGMLCYLCVTETLVHPSFEFIELTRASEDKYEYGFLNHSTDPRFTPPAARFNFTGPTGAPGQALNPKPGNDRRRRRRQINPRQGSEPKITTTEPPFRIGTTWRLAETPPPIPKQQDTPSFRWGPLPCPANSGDLEDDMIVECAAGVEACFKIDGFEVRIPGPNENGSVWKIEERGCFEPGSEDVSDTDPDRQRRRQGATRRHDPLLVQSKNNKCVDGKQNGTDILANKRTIFEAKVCICDGTRPHAEPDTEGGEEPYTERNPKMPCNQSSRNGIAWMPIVLVPLILEVQRRCFLNVTG